MQTSPYLAFAARSCLAVGLAGLSPAMAGQSYLYPPEVRIRPVVLAPDPSLQRHYWDPRDDDFCRAALHRRHRCLPYDTSR